jgi:hypothetical protein
MQGTSCDFCDHPAAHRCHAANCLKKMCEEHTCRQRDMGTQPLGTTQDPYVVFLTFCPDHADHTSL